MTGRVAVCAALCAPALGCTALDDVVFEPLALVASAEPLVVQEGQGMVAIPLRLTHAPEGPLSARYTLTELDAQSSCQSPDFYGGTGRVEWAAGELEASVSVWIADDDAAELDEAFVVKLDELGGVAGASAEVRVVIADDDRSGVVDARAEFGFEPGRAGEQSAALARALGQAAELGRGVVWVAPGDYEVLGVTLAPGTTLSGRGARFHRPAGSPSDAVALSVPYAGSVDSTRTLIEGLTLDGQRGEQGPFTDDELVDSHLLAITGNSNENGRLRVAAESLTLEDGAASGVFVGPQAEVTLCRLHCTELWRDAITLRGGGSSLDVRELDASATLGTTGLWFDGQPAGFGGTHRIDVSIADTELDSGDLEIEAYDGSRVELTRFQMARGPLRIQAPDASVRITDSLLRTGLASPVHNFFGLPHDVILTRTTLVVSPTDADGLEVAAEVPALIAANVRWQLSGNDDLPPLLPAAAPPHAIVFEQCRFERGKAVSATTPVFAVGSAETGGTLTLRGAALGTNVAAFAPDCTGCALEP